MNNTALCGFDLFICDRLSYPHHMPKDVAVVVSEVFLRRLIVPLTHRIKDNCRVRIIDMHRPIDEIISKLSQIRPCALITEWLPDLTDQLLALNLPTVISDTDFTYPNTTSIDVDDLEIGREAARYFLRSGHQHFACITNGTPYSDQRAQGFRKELATHQQSPHCRHEHEHSNLYYMESWQQDRPALIQWLKDLPSPVGLFAVHDPLGLAACDSAHLAGLNTPGDVAVLGVNDDELVCHLAYPSLSSISIPWNRLADEVSSALDELLNTGEPRSEATLVPPGPVITRRSTELVAIQDPVLRRCMHFLQQRYQEPVNITVMCDELRLSRRMVERKFAQKLQLTPWQMLTRLRIDAAKKRLQESALPIAHIAELSGFGDSERLAVAFKKATGMRPSDLRKSTHTQP